MSKRETPAGAAARFLRRRLLPSRGGQAVHLLGPGHVCSGVRRVYLFGTEVVHDHAIGVSRKRAAGKTNAYRDRLLPRAALTREPSQQQPSLPTKSSLPRCLWIYIAIVSVQ